MKNGSYFKVKQKQKQKTKEHSHGQNLGWLAVIIQLLELHGGTDENECQLLNAPQITLHEASDTAHAGLHQLYKCSAGEQARC